MGALTALAASLPALAQDVDMACLSCVRDEIRHVWRIPGHTVFSTPVELQHRCGFIEFPAPEFFVAGDGTTSSLFEVQHVVTGSCTSSSSDPLPVFVNDSWAPVAEPDPEIYGVIELEERTSDSVRFTYTHPLQPPPRGSKFREVRIGLVYWNAAIGEPAISSVLRILVTRPPVVMTHGLWSDRASFAAMEGALADSDYPRALLHRVDYEASNDHPFAGNSRVVEQGVYAALNQAAADDYAAGKVDLVGHSMGGLLSRLYVQSPLYPLNRDVRRIVTCNTPHSGSQMANWLLQGSAQARTLCAGLGVVLGSCYSGAVEDLAVGSTALQGLVNGSGRTPGDIQVHALVTVDEIGSHLPPAPDLPFVLGSIKDLYLALLGPCSAPGFFEAVFSGDDHDLVVAARSQAGGLNGLATSAFPGFMHIGSTARSPVIDQTMSLLNDPQDSERFAASYTPTMLSYTAPPTCYVPPLAVAGPLAASLVVTQPAAGASLTAGAPVTIAVDGSADIASVLVLLRATGEEVFLARKMGSEPSFHLTVPAELAGEQTIVAVGLDAAGNAVATSAEVRVKVAVPAELESLSVHPPSLFMAPGQTHSLEITGRYDDGVTRDLSQVDELEFSFTGAHTARVGNNHVALKEPVNDVLVVSLGGVSSPEVPIVAFTMPADTAPVRPLRRSVRN